jgi:hypothetical protein
MIDNKYSCNVNVLMHTDSCAIRTMTGGRIQTILFISTSSTAALYRVTPKKRELLKNPTKIEEIQEKKFIDRN